MKLTRLNILLTILILCINKGIAAQEWFPANGFLYDPTNVARVDITIDQDSLDLILYPGNEESDHEFPAVFTFKRGATQSTIDSIGFRLRGNTSRVSQKKSFKVSLNTFIRGQKYHMVEKINLNGEHNDPSISRAHICWELFRRAGVPAPRSGHSELYINGEYKGLYINVEHIDEEFVKLRFGNNDGNLYKCLWPADLIYLGTNPDNYKFEHSGRLAYELKTNLEQNDYSDIANLIQILHNTDPGDFPEFLEPVFNVNTYLKNLVVEVLTGHWDAYSYNKNNYYLYHNQTTDKFEFIPYDPDNTLGISWAEIDWTHRDIYDWSARWEDRPLTKKILQNDVYRARFSFYMNRFLSSNFNSAKLDPFIDGIKSQIQSYAENDLYRTYDYEYSYNDFLNSFDQTIGAHVRKGIKPYISSRNTSALLQVESVDIAPAITIASINQPAMNEELKISALVEDELSVSDVTAYFSENGGDFTAVQMTPGESDFFSSSYPGISTSGFVSFYIEAKDQQMQMTREPPFGAYKVNFGLVSESAGLSPQVDLLVYPNPASISFRVDVETYSDNYIYDMYNLSGQKVLSGSSRNSSFDVQLSKELQQGLYILEVRLVNKGTSTMSIYKKILIQR